MRQEDILRLPSMPMAGPSYPAGPYRFINREFLVITYETDPDLIRMGLPEPLEPIEQPIVHYEWIKMPDIRLRQLHRDRPRDPRTLQGRGRQLRLADVSGR
jgi:acetoacetate decarboxylase